MIDLRSNTIQAHVAFEDINKNIKYLVLQRSKDVFPYPSLWQVITGKIEENETAIEATMRELFEETGIINKELWYLPYVTSFFIPKINSLSFAPVFGTIVNEKNIVLSEEHQDYKWLEYDEVIEILELPSHKEATKIFRDYIINNPDRKLFKVK